MFSFPKIPAQLPKFGLLSDDAKLSFRTSPKGVRRLAEEKNIPLTDDEYWSQYVTLFDSGGETFTLISPGDIHRAAIQCPENVATLLQYLVGRLTNLLGDHTFPSPPPSITSTLNPFNSLPINLTGAAGRNPTKEALNCVRVLSRVLPVVFGQDNIEWEKEVMWKREVAATNQSEPVSGYGGSAQATEESQFVIDDGDEDEAETPMLQRDSLKQAPSVPVERPKMQPSLAERLIDNIIDLLFCAGFTLPSQTQVDHHKIQHIIWEKGVGSSYTPPTTSREQSYINSNRAEVLRLLLILFSKQIYLQPSSILHVPAPYTQYFVQKVPRKLVLTTLCSLLNVVINSSPASNSQNGSLGAGIAEVGKGISKSLNQLPYSQVWKGDDSGVILASLAAQVLVVALDYQSGTARDLQPAATTNETSNQEDAPTHVTSESRGATAGISSPKTNHFRYFVSRIHRPSDFGYLIDGITGILVEELRQMSSFIGIGLGALQGVGVAGPPNPTNSLAQEMAMLLWKLLEINRKFSAYVTGGDRAVDVIACILCLGLELKDKPNLAVFTLARGLRDIKQREDETRIVDNSDSTLVKPTRSSGPSLDAPHEEKARLLATEGRVSPPIVDPQSLAREREGSGSLANTLLNQSIESLRIASPPPTSSSSWVQESRPAFSSADSGRELSEKARGKLRERNDSADLSDPAERAAAAAVGKNGFVPTQEWVTSWQRGLPIDPILLTITELLPKVQQIQSSMNRPSSSPAVLDFLRVVDLKRTLPQPPLVQLRPFLWTESSLVWITSLIWGDIYVKGMSPLALWNGTNVRLFYVKQAQPAQRQITEAVSNVMGGILGRGEGALWRLLVHIENVHAQSVTTGSYVPVTNVQCPEDFTRRTLGEAFLLDPREQEYITGRRALLPDAWSQWLADPSSIGYSLQDLKLTTGEDVPAIALASSGGGYRSALFSAGALTAFDIRNDTAKHIGTGGLLQVSLFHSGLSGGAWLATSLAIHGLPTTRDLILGNTEHGGNLTGWLLDRDLLLPDDFKAVDFYDDIVAQVRSKAEAGFDTGLPDLWSRALAYHLLPGTSESNFFSGTDSHGAGILFSDLRQNIRFMQKEMPLPLVVVNARPPLFENAPPGTNLPLESTVYEITPFEFGSYDPQLSAFIDVKYLGTALDELKPKSPGSCVTNFDQADFVAGSSSSLFFALLYEGRRKLDRIEAGAAEVLLDALGDLLKD
ncbi:hypothetical protein FRC17_011140, partial [Serendipita sp. 399]